MAVCEHPQPFNSMCLFRLTRFHGHKALHQQFSARDSCPLLPARSELISNDANWKGQEQNLRTKKGIQPAVRIIDGGPRLLQLHVYTCVHSCTHACACVYWGALSRFRLYIEHVCLYAMKLSNHRIPSDDASIPIST